MEPVSAPEGLGGARAPRKSRDDFGQPSPNSPSKAGLLKTVPKERGSETDGNGVLNWTDPREEAPRTGPQLPLRMRSSSHCSPAPFPASQIRTGAPGARVARGPGPARRMCTAGESLVWRAAWPGLCPRLVEAETCAGGVQTDTLPL